MYEFFHALLLIVFAVNQRFLFLATLAFLPNLDRSSSLLMLFVEYKVLLQVIFIDLWFLIFHHLANHILSLNLIEAVVEMLIIFMIFISASMYNAGIGFS